MQTCLTQIIAAMQTGLPPIFQDQTHFIPNGSIVFVQRYWFQGLLLSLAAYILLTKDVSIQMGLSTADGIFADAAAAPTGNFMQENVAMPTSLRSNEAVNTSALTAAKKNSIKKADKKKVPVANTFSNLTPLLSPGYAQRKGIDKAIVQEKLDMCAAYVKRFAPVALEEMKQFGIPASITLAQGLLESNVGESRLASESNNHFGIKCRSKCRSCTCRNYSDDDIYDMFRVFDSPWESFREHSALLASSRYKHLTKYGNNYKDWAYGLKKAGYATDKRYPEKLIQIIDIMELHQYDTIDL